jgi:hypothetical protein
VALIWPTPFYSYSLHLNRYPHPIRYTGGWKKDWSTKNNSIVWDCPTSITITDHRINLILTLFAIFATLFSFLIKEPNKDLLLFADFYG